MRRRLPLLRSVRARLTLWNVLVLALVLVVLGGVLQRIVAHNLQLSLEVGLREHAQRYINFWANVPRAPRTSASSSSPPRPPRTSRAQRAARSKPPTPAPSNQQTRWQTPIAERIFDSRGVQRFPQNPGAGPWDRPAFERALGSQRTYSTVDDSGTELRVYSAPLRDKTGSLIGVVQVAASLQEIDRAVGNLNQALLMLVPLGLLAAWTGGMFLTGRMLRPVREVTQTASHLSAQDLSQRLVVSGQDEFSELAATFNGMLGRLEQSFEQQRRFTADASHELRTPLTVIKSVASRFLSRKDLPDDYRRGIERLNKSADTMERVVEDLLLLARSDTGQLALEIDTVPVATVLEEALAVVPAEGGPTLCYEAPELALTVLGDPNHLTRLFSNLVDNALRHTPPEGSITVSAQSLDNQVQVTVADTGIGIAETHLPHLTERFYRVDTARARAQGGTGLGLAICQSIVTAHAGTLRIESTPGSGTQVIVTLPRS